MNFIFIVNDLNIGDRRISGQQIIESLLKNKKWLYTSNTPNLKKISKSDKVLVYLAGPGRRYFVASFEISGDVKSNQLLSSNQDKDENEIIKLFRLSSTITNIQVFEEPIYLEKELRDKLKFIIDKKNWGLFFRQSTKIIDECDYKLLIEQIDMLAISKIK